MDNDHRKQIQQRVVTAVLERSANNLDCQAPEDGYLLMLEFISQAAHIAKALADNDRICAFLDALSEHLPECQEGAVIVEVDANDLPLSATKH